MRLIDLDKYMDKVCTYWKTGCGSCVYNEACPINEPIIEERKTGQWLREEKHYKDSEYDFHYYEEYCSACGVRRRIGWRGTNYCPNCGAKLEVEE